MGIRDILRRVTFAGERSTDGTDALSFSVDRSGLTFVTDPAAFRVLSLGEGSREALEQLVLLRMLVEQGFAHELPNGFEVPTEHATRLSADEVSVLGVPPRFDGEFLTEVKGHTSSSSFRVTVKTRLRDHPEPWARKGPILRVGDGEFLLTPPMVAMLEAIEQHGELTGDERTEVANVSLIGRLQSARAMHPPVDDVESAEEFPLLEIDLKQFNEWTTVAPERVGIVTEEQADGSLRVSPNLGAGLDAGLLENRWHQIAGKNSGVLRVGKTLINLDESAVAGVREVLSNRVIPQRQVKAFLAAPAAFFDASLVDLDMGFSVRVTGVGAIDAAEFAEQLSSGLDWFGANGVAVAAALILGQIDSLEELTAVRDQCEEAWERGDSATVIDDEVVDIRDRDDVLAAFAEADARIANMAEVTAQSEIPTQEKQVKVGLLLEEETGSDERLARLVREAVLRRPVDYDSLLRSPFPHQQEGIEWMARLMQSSLDGDDASPTRIQGAILADDMGLGKTYMTLVALREFLWAQRAAGGTERPTLAVLPLSLVENWEEEIGKTFVESPFRDLVVMQSARDLSRYRVKGAGPETRASADSLDSQGRLAEGAIKFALRVGPEWGPDRLDMPGRLVLTTYDALRDYQLSFAQVDWGVVVFDEAQNVKDPGAIRTRAAKGLKARFKLMATGTPIENSIRDLWCLMDTAQPGFLGTWRDFNASWLTSANGDEGLTSDMGADIRSHIGEYMLRRTKAEHLTGLPSKTIYTGISVDEDEDVTFDPLLAEMMPDRQRAAYDDELARYKSRRVKSPGDALKTLQALRSISLHPALTADGALDGPEQAARVTAMWRVLDRVRDADEKVIIFVIDKQMQRRMAVWIQQRYGVRPDVVNGETKAVSTGGADTRRSLIARFESARGFNLIIMSPLAVGVGLTITGANHAVFLERHWNPAKEAQATDRIYRIGQTRPVHVYMPIAKHPQVISFDAHMDALLRQKTVVKDAVMASGEISRNELMGNLGLLG